MKLSTQTLDILKNFSALSPNLHVSPGQQVRTLTSQILAIADIPDSFPKEFAIYDLGKFLSVVKTFDDPELDFQDEHVIIREGNTHVRYLYAGASAIEKPPESLPDIPDVRIDFDLPQKTLQNAMQAAAILKLPDITVRSRNGNLELVARDKSRTQHSTDDSDDSDSNEHVTVIGSYDGDASFKIDFKASNLSSIMATDYKATIGVRRKNAALLYLESPSILYGIASEKTTEYNGDV